MPEISVIVPVFNSEKFLKECLDSILSQTYGDLEVICVNDGSTDNSLDILNQYKNSDSRVKVIDKENSGYGASLNMGIDAAQGNYIGIVESDDFIKENMYEELIKLAHQYDAEIVKSNWYSYFGNFWGGGKPLCRKESKIRHSQAFKLTNSNEDANLLRITPSVWSAIYKKDFLKHYDIKFLETAGASYQDVSFSFKVFALAQRVVFTDEAYLMYRRDNENSSVKRLDKVYCICDEYNELDKFLNSYPELKSKFNYVKNINQYNSYMWNTLRIDDKFKLDFVNEFSKSFKEKYEAGELNDEFFKRISSTNFKILIDSPQKFLKVLKTENLKDKIKSIRKNIISVKLNKSGLDVVIFGKKIIGI